MHSSVHGMEADDQRARERLCRQRKREQAARLLRAPNRDRLGCRSEESETGLGVQLRPSKRQRLRSKGILTVIAQCGEEREMALQRDADLHRRRLSAEMHE